MNIFGFLFLGFFRRLLYHETLNTMVEKNVRDLQYREAEREDAYQRLEAKAYRKE